ncbi:MAG: DUF2914 domain-containing protein [Gemmatimonadota bacterium]|nr:DUF2914 domain-containing protein [Gemmatimonadota bacterium]
MKTWSAAATLAFITALVPASAAAQDAPGVELVLGTGIEAMMPVGESQEFPADVGRVFCWTLLEGAAGSTIQHVWIYGDMEFPVSLEVDGSPWRTWSSKSIPPEWSGEWTVEVRDDSGAVLRSQSFVVGM